MNFPHYPPPFWELPAALESEHFILHFVLRNPREGKGRGAQGVRDHVLVLAYVEALERLYRTMISPPWSREPPVTDSTGKTHVYICNYYALTSDETLGPITSTALPVGVPYIILPSRCNEPTIQAELHKATAEAVHEATHVFNYSQRQFHELTSHAWKWFDEAFAVFMETYVVSGNQDYFRYVMDWIDRPEIPLDAGFAKYQAGMFLRYLANINDLGPQFINEVWTKSRKKEKPFEALNRLLQMKGLTLSCPNPEIVDIFGSGYCLEPYFLWHHRSPSLAPDILIRYGERAVSESWEMKSGRSELAKGVLDHLACRYYRYYLGSGVQTLNVMLLSEDSGEVPLKGEIVIITKDRERSTAQALTANNPQAGANTLSLSIEIQNLNPDLIDHIVLVVSNCGLRAAGDDEEVEHDDQKHFTVQSKAT